MVKCVNGPLIAAVGKNLPHAVSSFGWYSSSKDKLCGLSLNWFHMWSHSLLLPLISSEKSVSIEKLSSSWGWIQCFRNSNFCLNAWVLSLTTNTVSYLPPSHRLHSFSRKCLPCMQTWIIIVFLSFFQVKMVLHRENNSFSSKLKQFSKCFSKLQE